MQKRTAQVYRYSAIFTMFVGGMVLVGWGLGIEALKSVCPGWATMKMNTALCFMAAGGSLLLMKDFADRALGRIALPLAIFVTLVSAATLFEHYSSANLGIDELLIRDIHDGIKPPGQMSPATAVNFLILGIALLSLKLLRPPTFTQILSLLILGSSELALLGYAYGVKSLYAISGFSSMAVNTALAFFISGIGLLAATSQYGFMKVATSNTAGGISVRRLLPPMLLLLFGLGWIRMVGQDAGLYDTRFGLALMISVSSVICAFLVLRQARILYDLDIIRLQHEAKRAEAEAQNAMLAAIVNSSDDAIFSIDLHGKVASWNSGAERIFGYSADEMVGQPYHRIIPAGMEGEEALFMERIKRGEKIDHYETRRKTSDGRLIDVSVTISPIKNSKGEIVAASKVARDITEHKQKTIELERANRELAAANAAFQQLADAMPQIVWAAGPDGHADYYNKKWYELSGAANKESADQSWMTILHPDDRKQCIDKWQHSVKTGEPFEIEYRFRFPKIEEYRWHLGRALPVRDETGAIVRWYGTCTEIHEAKSAQESLQESESRFRRAVSESPIPMIIREEGGKVLQLSKGWTQYSGYSIADIPTIEDWVQKAYGEQRRDLSGFIKNLFQLDKTQANGEFEITAKDGSKRCWDFYTTPLGESARGQRLILSTAIDITQRNAADLAIRELNKDLEGRVQHRTAELNVANAELASAYALQQAILDSADHGIVSVSLTGIVTAFNRGAEKLLGYVASEVINIHTPALWHDHDEIVRRAETLSQELGYHLEPGIESNVAKARLGLPDESEWTFIRKDGSRVPVLLSLTAIKDEAGTITGYLGVVADITERKRQEEAIRQSEERFRNAVEYSPIGMSLVALNGRWMQVNQALCDIIGYSREELVRSTFQEITHPEDLDLDLGNVGKLLSGELTHYHMEKRYFHKDGSIVWVLLSVSMVRARDGSPLYFVSQIQDITERKHVLAELKLKESRLREAQRIARLGNWEWTIATDTVVWSEELYQIAGLDPSQPPPNYESQDEIYKPSSLKKLNAAVERTIDDGLPYEIELEMIRPDKTSRWVIAKGEPIRDGQGRITRLVGTVLDVTETAQMRAELDRVTERLRLANAGAGIGIWDWDIVSNKLVWDEQMYNLYGISRNVFSATYDAWKYAVHPDDRVRAEADLQAALDDVKPFDSRFRVLWPNGELRHIRAMAVVQRAEDGKPVNIVGTNWDITAQALAEESVKAALDEKVVLLKEIHHRVKNNLQIVSSLLSLQSEKTTETQSKLILEDCKLRIRAMVMVHERMYRSRDLARLELGDFLKELCADLSRAFSANSIRMVIQTEPMNVDIDTAIPCALLTCEAVTNAYKYAFQNEASGTIQVRLSKMQEPGCAVLEIADNGVGLKPDFRPGKGLGMQLIRGFARQMNGEMSLDGSKGTRIVVAFKLEHQK